MAKLKAAVLAAGRGIRMGGETPKTLATLDTGESLLHYILKGLQVCGFDDLLVITGFKAPAVEAFVAERWDKGAAFVFNARWASWGNFHSVRMAIDQSAGSDLLVVNSDVIVHPDVFRKTVGTRGDLVLAVQRRPNLDEEDMRVELSSDQIRAIGKDLRRTRSHGEFAGVSLLRGPAARTYSEMATDLEWRAETTGYYEDLYAALLGRVDARAAFVRQDEYAEVDLPGDLPAAAAVAHAHRDAWTTSPAPERQDETV